MRKLAKSSKLNISAICLNFTILNEFIDKVVIGVDNKENLLENIEDLKKIERVQSYMDELKQLREDDENLILPFNWRI